MSNSMNVMYVHDIHLMATVYYVLGQGIPNRRASDRRTSLCDPTLVPTPSEAVRLFRQAGGHLQLFSKFGADPLDGRLRNK